MLESTWVKANCALLFGELSMSRRILPKVTPASGATALGSGMNKSRLIVGQSMALLVAEISPVLL
jgi:hypothetical protein